MFQTTNQINYQPSSYGGGVFSPRLPQSASANLRNLRGDLEAAAKTRGHGGSDSHGQFLARLYYQEMAMNDGS